MPTMSAARFFQSVRSILTPENVNTFVRIYNLATALLVLDDYIKNSGTENAKNSVEYFGDITIHFLQAALTYDSSIQLKVGTLLLNGGRLAQIPYLISQGIATVPNGIAIVDALNHFANTVDTTTTLCLQPKSQIQPKMR